MKKLFFLSVLILFSCSKLKRNYKNIDVDMIPMGLVEVNCDKKYSTKFYYNSNHYVVENIADKYKDSWTSLPVTIDFKVIKKIKCVTESQTNTKLYEVKILSIKDR